MTTTKTTRSKPTFSCVASGPLVVGESVEITTVRHREGRPDQNCSTHSFTFVGVSASEWTGAPMNWFTDEMGNRTGMPVDQFASA